MSEAAEYQWLRKSVFRSPARCQRIESLIGLGIPDTNVCIAGVESWVEIKAPTEPKRPGSAMIGGRCHPLSQDQKNFFLAQRRAGGRAYLWVGSDKRRLLLPGFCADPFNEMTVMDMILASLWHCPRAEKPNLQELLQCFKK